MKKMLDLVHSAFGGADAQGSKAKRLGCFAALLVVCFLGCVVLWQGRYWVIHLVRVAWRRLTLSREPQQIDAVRCPGAPWLLPTSGVLGVLWNDGRVPPYGPRHPHTGLDIFGQGGENTVPVYAVADGHLTRFPGWRSAVIIRHEDPLRPGETVWTYYSHMASAAGSSYIAEEFPAGTAGVPVQAGQLIGYQGVWSGHPLKPGWMHLHFSVVRSDENGSFLNETVPGNTLDPSPYLGIDGNADEGAANWRPLTCRTRTP